MSAFLNDIASVATVGALLLTAFGAGVAFGANRVKLTLNKTRELERFTEIYAPLMGLFTTCHITIVSCRGAPYLSQRIANARELMTPGSYGDAFKALFDKQDFPELAEVEYGESFPLSKITRHLQGREKFADDRLITLISHANRAQFEESAQDNSLSDAELKLYHHISSQHRKLARRFVGGS